MIGDGETFRVEVKAVDWAGNEIKGFTTGYYMWDETVPSVSLIAPVTGYVNALATISGTAWDTDPDGPGGSKSYSRLKR